MATIARKLFGLEQFLLFIFVYISATSSRVLKDFPEECQTFMEIDDDTRAFDNYHVSTSQADDLKLKKGWYRILGKSWGKSMNSLKQGFPKIPKVKTTNLPNLCGTVYAGTLMGEHPTVDEEMVEMTVCFRERFCYFDDNDSGADVRGACGCARNKTIYVRNCMNHYIYWLSPTNNKERYCTGTTALTDSAIKDGSRNAVECQQGQYKTFDSSSRVWNKVSHVTCDEESGWYRFTGAAGDEMASQCIPNTEPISRLKQPCGAAFRGWMVDRHPTISEGRRNARICFSYPDACGCEFFANVAVRNCGNFFVYKIRRPPICQGRYCGAPKGSSAAVNDLTKPMMRKKTDLCQRYNVLHDASRLWSYTSPTESNCDSKLYGNFRFGSKYTPWSIKEGCSKNDMNIVTHRCGARYQGYMEFRHPTVSEGFIERIICFQDATAPCECQFSTVIGVQNCSGFYVYDLRGVPNCQSRLCMVANGSVAIKITPNRPPTYGIPVPGYTVAEKDDSPPADGEDESVFTTTILCIIILIILILIVIIILTVLYIAHPVIWPPRDKEVVADVKDSGPPDRNELLVESCLADEIEDEEVGENQYSSVDDPPEKQEDDIVKRSDLVPDTPPEERRSLDQQEDDLIKKPDSEEEEVDEKVESPQDEPKKKSVSTIDMENLDDLMNDLDATRSDIDTLLLASDNTTV